MDSSRAQPGIQWHADASGAVVIVTGASSGIGHAIAEAFSEAGATVIGIDKAAPTVAGAGILLRECDVRDTGLLDEAVRSVGEGYARIDCLVNNVATFAPPATLDEVQVSVFEDLWEVNVRSYFTATAAALPYLRRSRGSIINISSAVAHVGQWRDAAYATTKGAVSAMTKAVAIDEATSGVRANAVVPGSIRTARADRMLEEGANPAEVARYYDRWQWLGRRGMPEEVASACLFLASGAASFITGAELFVTGGIELGYGPKGPYPD